MLEIFLSLIFFVNQSRIIINEVMANPKGSSGPGLPEDRNEFVELYNNSLDTINLLGWRITDFDATDSLIAWTDSSLLKKYPQVVINSTQLPPQKYALILDPEYTMSKPLGGYAMPYDFPSGILILTVGNTTIGNELQNNDPILLYSPNWAETTSFGTPCDTTDTFPYSAGDGIAWERIAISAPDFKQNWRPAIDPTGSTPGRENSILSFQDLAISNFYTLAETIGVTLVISLLNQGFQDAKDWSVLIFNDLNYNQRFDANEKIGLLTGNLLKAQLDTTVTFDWLDPPPGNNEVWARIEYPLDQDTTNNQRLTYVYKSPAKELCQLPHNRFSPDRDGFEDSLLLRYEVPEIGGNLLISVFDLKGKAVATILKTKLNKKTGSIVWDGKTDTGKPLPAGIYLIKFDYKLGKEHYEEKKSVILAKNLKR